MISEKEELQKVVILAVAKKCQAINNKRIVAEIWKAAVDGIKNMLCFNTVCYKAKKEMLIVDWICDKNCLQKTLELTEKKEAVSFDRIPRKREMSLKTTLREIKREEAEKFNW